MKYIQIVNWEEFQHYKNRNPPWIKLHNQTLENYNFACLPDASKAHLLCLWMLASRTENKIPANPQWIANKIGANSLVDLTPLFESGFIEEHPASTELDTRKQNAPLEEKRQSRDRGETETEKKAVANAPLCDLFAELWDGWPTGYGEKGSRKNAEAAFIKIKPDRQLFDQMLSAVQDQWQAKNRNALAGGFVPNFKHVERWLKGREWEIVIDSKEPINSVLNNLQDRSWAQ